MKFEQYYNKVSGKYNREMLGIYRKQNCFANDYKCLTAQSYIYKMKQKVYLLLDLDLDRSERDGRTKFLRGADMIIAFHL